MELNKAHQLAVRLMVEHNLIENGWKFDFDTAKRRFGCCNYTDKEITLSIALVLVNDEVRVKNTILHEIAHALVGRGHGHNNVWKKMAIAIGCDGKRCFTTENTTLPESKYIAVCNSCGYIHKRHKLSKKASSCSPCGNGRFKTEYILTFKLNPKYFKNFNK